jgi:drug/metabolite transporter (DMT)-like permease
VKSRLYLLAAAALWSTAGAGMKLCALSALQITGARSLVAGLFLLAVVPEARRRPRRRMALAAGAYAATVILFVLANKLTTAANAIFIQDTAPLWVLFLSIWLLHERPRRGDLLAIPVYGVGLALFFFDELSAGQRIGNLIALASGLTFALLVVGMRLAREDAKAALVLGNLLAAALTLPFWGLGPAPRPVDLAIVAYLGVVQLGLAYVCFGRGIERVPALEASLLVLLEPVLNPIWTFLLAGERPGPWALAGASVVVAATIWRTLAVAAERPENPPPPAVPSGPPGVPSGVES